MASLATTALNIPNQILDPWLGKVQGGSVIAALSPNIPMKFGAGQAMTFNIGEAEYVGEGAQKGASTVTPTSQVVTPFKFHKTIRMNEEVKWADEDGRIQAIDEILTQIQPALSRALDYGVIHGINPTGGATVAAMTQKLSAATNQVERVTISDKAYANLDAADALVLANGYSPSGLALDPAFAAKFAALRGIQSEAKLYPDFRLTTETSLLEAHTASVSKTVGAVGVAAVASNILAIDGDFSAVRWGIQRQIGLELIEYGDPDGGGDLKRNNQIAFRAEVVYGWGIADLLAFALIVDKVAG